MPLKIARHIELLNLGHALRRHASERMADANAAALLVHKVLAAAFAEAPGERASGSLKSSLFADIDRRLAACHA